MAERVYYNRDGVKITTTRAFFGRQVYAVNGMTSVRMARINPDRMFPVAFMLIGAFMSCICGVLPIGSSLWERDATPALFGIIMLLTGVGVVAWGVLWYKSLKVRYAVVVRTASGEVKALVTWESAMVEEIVAALSQAFADRG